MEKAIQRARSGLGASVIEMMTYRLSDHTTADDARRYRPDDEVQDAWDKEPIKRLHDYLTQQGAWDETKEQALLEECAGKVDEAVEEYLAVGKPDIASMFDYMYAELPHDLAAQRERALEELK
jgi:pyruvate dehydrogenase E1 component alpha subunit